MRRGQPDKPSRLFAAQRTKGREPGCGAQPRPLQAQLGTACIPALICLRAATAAGEGQVEGTVSLEAHGRGPASSWHTAKAPRRAKLFSRRRLSAIPTRNVRARSRTASTRRRCRRPAGGAAAPRADGRHHPPDTSRQRVRAAAGAGSGTRGSGWRCARSSGRWPRRARVRPSLISPPPPLLRERELLERAGSGCARAAAIVGG